MAEKEKKKKKKRVRSLRARVIKALILFAILLVIPLSLTVVREVSRNYLNIFYSYIDDMMKILGSEVYSYKDEILKALEEGKKDKDYDLHVKTYDAFIDKTNLTDIIIMGLDGDDMIVYAANGSSCQDYYFGQCFSKAKFFEENELDKEGADLDDSFVLYFPGEDIDTQMERTVDEGALEFFFGKLGNIMLISDEESDEPDMVILSYLRGTEVMRQVFMLMLNIFVMAFIIVALVLIVMGTASVKKLVNPIRRMAGAADELMKDTDSEMTPEERFGRNLFGNIKVDNRDEIGVLYRSLSGMENSLGEYLKELMKVTSEKQRMGTELDVATNIQAEMLPRVFPPFPDRNEFEVFASMDPAKEVGGDFYDFFFIDDDHLVLVIADVSGKGVPASLFMVISKTMIKNSLQQGHNPAAVLAEVNNSLCEGNESKMFVTVWLAVVEVSTGKVIEVNAGHEHPAFKKSGGEFELIKYPHGPALGILPGMSYKEREYEIKAGDRIFVYTDGIPEAADPEYARYGNERLIAALNSNKDEDVKTICEKMRADISDFAKDAEQFDDITMLCFDYKGIIENLLKMG